MGNDISKKDNLDAQFKEKSKYIVQELDNFFGPIEGFKWQGEGEGEAQSVPSLSTYEKDLNLENLEKLKEERDVCSHLIGAYKNSLKGMLKDKDFKSNVNDFLKTKKVNPERISIDVRIDTAKFDPATNKTICDKVIRYYFLKYKIYRLLKNLDPYSKNYNDIVNMLQNDQDIKDKQLRLSPKKIEAATRGRKKMEDARNKFRNLIMSSMNNILNDELTYPEMKKLEATLQKDKTLSEYCKSIYNVGYNITKLKKTNDLDNFDFDFDGELEICNKINLNDSKNGNIELEEWDTVPKKKAKKPSISTQIKSKVVKGKDKTTKALKSLKKKLAKSPNPKNKSKNEVDLPAISETPEASKKSIALL